MRNQAISIALVIVLLCPFASAQWVRIPQSPGGQSLAVSGPNIFVASESRYMSPAALYTSTDNGTTWDTIKNFTVYSFAVSGTKVYAGGSGLKLSTDNGLSWVDASSTGHPITAVAISGTNIFAGTSGGGVFLSTDSGQSWNALSPGWTGTTVRAIALSGADLFAGTTGGVVLSTDNGSSWSAANSGLPPTMDVRALLVHRGYIYAGLYKEGVFVSTNNSANWNKANTGSSNHCGGKAFAFDGIHLFAGTEEGVFVTSNGGKHWSAANSGLTDTVVYALGVSGRNLLALTNSGVWKRALSEMTTSLEAEPRVPTQFALEQNYPNPFNPTTTIKFQLPTTLHVNLVVFDILGREVSVLVNERRDAGFHEVEFDASRLSSSGYVFRFQAGDYVASKKMLVLK